MIDTKSPPGWPGTIARWTSSAKDGVGTSLCALSRVWFTLSHGILNEVYYPRVDQACTRDMGLIITGQNFFSEEKRDTTSTVNYLSPGVPAYRLVNQCKDGRYRIEKEIVADPVRSVVLQRTKFVPLQGVASDYRVHVILAPHLASYGMGNTGWVGDYKGIPMLFAERGGCALALASSVTWGKRSVGFVGVSDGWQDISQHGTMRWEYGRAENGNIALTAEIDMGASAEFTLALAFGTSWAEAGQLARASLLDGFEAAKKNYIAPWQNWQKSLLPLDRAGSNSFRTSAAVLRVHESKELQGGIIASLSIPWGFSKGDADLGGYHLIWPRDMVETAGGLLAAGAGEHALRVLSYLQITQEADGHWPQNMWLDGLPYWNGVQMDEVAFPILLVNLLLREKQLDVSDLTGLWPMVRQAAGYLVCNGPVTQQDRWEEDEGYSPFTLAVEIAALVLAADIAETQGESKLAQYLLETADTWNDSIERWTYVSASDPGASDFARKFNVSGYYIRIATLEDVQGTASSPKDGFVTVKNRPVGYSQEPTDDLISTDFLALVRFGLRSADDPRIVDTLKIVDSLLRTEMPQGPVWHRYNFDGYGEHEDGSPFDGTGIGRAWPLLTGERALYELAAGNRQGAEILLQTVERSASAGGLISEQVWDAADLPKRELYFGHPSGSARPLVWAHAELIKLTRSLRDGRVFDQPVQTTTRYQERKKRSVFSLWSSSNKALVFVAGTTLRISLAESALVHWTANGWTTMFDTKAIPSGLGTFIADLETKDLSPGSRIVFTIYWQDSDRWENENYCVVAVPRDSNATLKTTKNTALCSGQVSEEGLG